jgi:hypothetical protein
LSGREKSFRAYALSPAEAGSQNLDCARVPTVKTVGYGSYDGFAADPNGTPDNAEGNQPTTDNAGGSYARRF